MDGITSKCMLKCVLLKLMKLKTRKICTVHRRSISSIVFKCRVFFNSAQYESTRICSTTSRSIPPWRVLFFGTDEFALPHLSALNENRLSSENRVVDSIEVVIPKSAKGAVHDYAETNQLLCHLWPIPTWPGRFDVGVVTSFGRLIPKRIINMFPFGILNVHPSLLPRWRGASPIIHTILNGDHITGITIIEIRPIHFDIGPILLQQSYSVPPDITASQLRDMLSAEGAKLLVSTLGDLSTLERMEHEQAEHGISYAHILKPDNAYVNWEVQTTQEIDRQYRALGDKLNLRSIWKESLVRLFEMCSQKQMQVILPDLSGKYPDAVVSPRPGLPYFHTPTRTLCIRCKGGWVGFRKLTYKKQMTAQEFYNGHLSDSRNLGVVFKSQENNLGNYAIRTVAAQPKLIVRSRNIS